MKYREHWWQFWRPVCQCPNKVEFRTILEEDMPSGGPGSTPGFMTAYGDWLWHYERCQDCGKVTKWGHWA